MRFQLLILSFSVYSKLFFFWFVSVPLSSCLTIQSSNYKFNLLGDSNIIPWNLALNVLTRAKAKSNFFIEIYTECGQFSRCSLHLRIIKLIGKRIVRNVFVGSDVRWQVAAAYVSQEKEGSKKWCYVVSFTPEAKEHMNFSQNIVHKSSFCY